MFVFSQHLAEYAEEHLEDSEAPLFLRFINLLINDAIYLLDEALSVIQSLIDVFGQDVVFSRTLCEIIVIDFSAVSTPLANNSVKLVDKLCHS